MSNSFFKMDNITEGWYYNLHKLSMYYVYGPSAITLCRVISKNYENNTIFVEGFNIRSNFVKYSIPIKYISSVASSKDIENFKMDLVRYEASKYNI